MFILNSNFINMVSIYKKVLENVSRNDRDVKNSILNLKFFNFLYGIFCLQCVLKI